MTGTEIPKPVLGANERRRFPVQNVLWVFRSADLQHVKGKFACSRGWAEAMVEGMATIPVKVQTRIKEALKRFKPVIEQAKARDIGEADTSTLVKDILADLFGYDKYTEITAEFQIKSTYCDLALRVDGKLALLIEVKAIGLELKETYVKQAVDYAANQGIRVGDLDQCDYMAGL